MPFTSAWDETKPAGSRNLNLGDDDIREFKQQVRERSDVDGYFPSADDAKTGYHRKATLIEQGSDPSAVADALIVYSKLTGSFAELYSRHENAAAQQLTLNGKLWIPAMTIASIAQGDILYYDGTIMNRLAPGTSGQFLKTLGSGANPAWANVGGSYINGHARNLKVTCVGSTHVVTLTADEVLVDNGSNEVQRFTAVNLTADIDGVVGAGALDVGTKAANTIYFLWLIAKADGTKALLLSASSSAPTMPADYTYKALLSCVGTNNSSAFISFTQTGRKYLFTTWAVLASGVNTASAWTAMDLTPANMTTVPGFVPSALSNFAFGTVQCTGAIAALTNDSSVATGATAAPNKFNASPNTAAIKISTAWAIDVLTADTLYYLSNDVSNEVYLQGFEITKLAA